MARAWRKNKQKARRMTALQNLKTAKFSEKTLKNGHVRTVDEWTARVNAEIAILERRI